MCDSFVTYTENKKVTYRSGTKSRAFQPYGIFFDKNKDYVAIGAFGPAVLKRFIQAVGWDAEVKGDAIPMYFEVTEIEIDETSASNEEWRKIMSAKLKSASCFEIHCWNEEQAEIEMALQYGRIKETGWSYGKVIAGTVTEKFANYLLSIPKPADTGAYNKMTPFFSVFLDNGFSSEHYGTELNQCKTGHYGGPENDI